MGETSVGEGPRCPLCGSGEVVPIRYGRPDEELRSRARRGEVVLGGEDPARDRPTLACGACAWRWRGGGRPA